VIAYLDASALVKRYLVERGSRETIKLTAESEIEPRRRSLEVLKRLIVVPLCRRDGRVAEDIMHLCQRNVLLEQP